MQNQIISVMGELRSDKIDSVTAGIMGTLIVSGSHELAAQANYICVNDVDLLEGLVKNKAEKTVVLTPKNYYTKYVFHNGVECVPEFEDLVPYNFDPYKCSQQSMSLALACWLGNPVIALFDYLLEPKKETPALKAIIKLYPLIQFFYIREKKGNKIGVLDDMPNVKQMDYKEFISFYERYVIGKN
jgi:hypothetical protein